jgi:glycogen synthase
VRICLITPQLPPCARGGIGVYVEALARGYAARGHTVTVAGVALHRHWRVAHEWGESVSVGRRFDVALGSIPVLWRLGPLHALWRRTWVRQFLQACADAAAVRRFLLASEGQFDVIETANYPGLGAFAPIGSARRVTRLSTPGQAPAVTRWLERRTCAGAELLITHSDAMRREARSYYEIDTRGALVVDLGVTDVEPRVTPPDDGRLHLVVVGRAELRKGTDLLVRALAVTIPRHEELCVTIVGGDPGRFCARDAELSVVWAALASRYPDRVRVTGPVSGDAKNDAIAGAHWALIPSRFESFGLVAIEAMRAGTPVLAARSGGLEEVCGRGGGSMLFAPDVSGVTGAIEAACRLGAAHALSLRPAARALYERNFRDAAMVDRSLAAYEMLLSRPRG